MLRTKMPDRLRWGILSTGNIARQFCAGVAASQRGELTAVASRRQESADPFAQQFKIPTAYGNYDSLLNDANVDAIYNALPNSLHHPWTVKSLRAGKHVLCEKPLAASAAEAQDMFDAAARAGKMLVEAFMYRSHPLTHAVLQAVGDGAIGKLKMVRTSFCYCTSRIAGNVRFSAELAGGGLMDVGCYCINFSRLLAGAEPTVCTVAATMHSSGVDELAVGSMRFANGVLASFTCGTTTHADNTAYVCGSDGYIEVPVPWKPPRQSVFVIARSTPPRMDDRGKSPNAPPPEVVSVNVEQELYGLEADDFAATVMDGKAPAVSREDSLGNMRVLDQLQRQIQAARL